jgi:predicted RNase H-like nuclease (RuvC/YqgF family)
LNSLIENKNEDIESLESSKIDLVTKINHYKNYEVKVNEYESVIKKLSDNIEAAKRDLDVYQNKCRGYENKIREMENNVNYTQQEKERLNGLNKNKSNEIEEYKNRLSKLEQEYRRMQEVDKVCQGLHVPLPLFRCRYRNTSGRSKPSRRRRRSTRTPTIGRRSSTKTSPGRSQP